MTAAAPNLRRHFLPWDRPLPAQAAAWLARDWTGQGPLDLSAVWVIVPTRHSGRRLREALAAHAAARHSAVLAPRVTLAEELVTPEDVNATVASRLETQLAWAEVLLGVDLEEFRAVFPVDPPARDFSWATRLAAQLTRLQATLAEGGLQLADVAERAGAELPEVERWQQLGALDGRHAAALAARGWQEPQAARLAAVRRATPPAGIARLVVFATPDPWPLALEALARFTSSLAVDVVIHGPADSTGEALFDAWGRPVAAAWARRPLELADFARQVHVCADPAEQAERVTARAQRGGPVEGRLAVGLTDAEVAPALENSLRAAGFAPFNPEGRPRRGDGLFALFAALAALVREPEFAAVAALARCPDFLAWLATRAGDGRGSPAAALAALDALHAAHLPATLAAAQAHAAAFPAARPLLAAAAEARERLTTGAFPANAAATLGELFGARRVPVGSALADAAAAWTETLRGCARAAEHFPGVTTAEWWDLALAQFGESVRFEERPAGAVDLLGWLELPWEDAPELIVTGMNDGAVPEAVVGDPFLPEALRARLGLKTNAARLARDAYLLAALAAARARGGRLDLLVGKTAATGDPLRPSRLLLACADDELPARVRTLFRPAPAARPGRPWRRAWRLVPPARPAPTRLAVTAFRDYLACPFRFYLKRQLKMAPVDPAKTELDALDFGILCHGALEALGHAPALRDCAEPEPLRKFLLTTFDAGARARYGADLTLPLLVQFESARQRLAHAATVLAEQRAAGWVVIEVERSFAHVLGGLEVRGKIDRLERHESTGAVRVLDFKTSDQPVAPRAAHVRAAAKAETAPDFARFTLGGEKLVWKDLQLPLYLEALAAEFGPAVDAGYFNLPKAVGATAVAPWEDFDATGRAAARRCAEGIVAAVTAGVFWPPAEVAPRDEDDALAGLFHHGTAASVDWRAGP